MKPPVGACVRHCGPFTSSSGSKRPRWSHPSNVGCLFTELAHVIIYSNSCLLFFNPFVTHHLCIYVSYYYLFIERQYITIRSLSRHSSLSVLRHHFRERSDIYFDHKSTDCWVYIVSRCTEFVWELNIDEKNWNPTFSQSALLTAPLSKSLYRGLSSSVRSLDRSVPTSVM